MKILVVEDEPLIRLGIAALVEAWGCAALGAAGADTAILIFERQAGVRVQLHIAIRDVGERGVPA